MVQDKWQLLLVMAVCLEVQMGGLCTTVHRCLRCATTTSQTHTMLIQHYQLYSGFYQPILENTNAIPWTTAPWVDNICKFLCHINGCIILKNPHCEHDQAIMEDSIQAYHFQCNKATQIESVCLFLKVNFLLEITDHTGCQLLPHMLEPQKPPSHSFYHINLNQSTLLWPQQPSPGRSAQKQ